VSTESLPTNKRSNSAGFKKILIANRGAIAVRLIRTFKRLGIASVTVFAESDRESLHVRLSDEAYSLGDGDARDTYLDVGKILSIAAESGADAVHPGYGFLSENSTFAEQCEQKGLVFIGPDSKDITQFGLKHRARELATNAGVPLLPGSNLLKDEQEATAFADSIGYPVMLKSTAGGGGIGLMCCRNAEELSASFEAVQRQGLNSFSDSGVFIEKFIANARHIEVQMFADGDGRALAVGERDCSSQRRNQKVIEECPAPGLDEQTRAALYNHSQALLASVNYRNIATVEYILDVDTGRYYFLEVNTRLQVEHGVTEEVYGVDLVQWMIEEAEGAIDLEAKAGELRPTGHAIQARIYAEDPYKQFQPSAGLLSDVSFPDMAGVRVDYWIESGIVVPDCFDPMLAKLIAYSDDRNTALAKLTEALNQTHIYGSVTNVDYLRSLSADTTLKEGSVTTNYLNNFNHTPCRIDVLNAGTQTTVQDFPGRAGYWHVGVPPSGPFDSYSFRLANQLLGNDASAAGIEITHLGPTLVFSSNNQIAITGAAIDVTADGKPVPMWQVVDVAAGQTIKFDRIKNAGSRAYLCVRGGLQCPAYLGSQSTFTLGQFGGHNGRALNTGDVLKLDHTSCVTENRSLDVGLIPDLSHQWELRVVYGPHGADDFFTQADIDQFFATDWEVHYNSSRTGIRLNGPKPEWAREDGGDAGLHPSNIHDNAYAFGSVDFTGDMPVILGPDGPSLGGFVCPATVIQADLWKLGQVRSGDTIRFVPVSLEHAVKLEHDQLQQIEQMQAGDPPGVKNDLELADPVVKRLSASDYGEDIVYRVAGDHFLLIEYGDTVLDIALRFRAHALMQWLNENELSGIKELTPGIRSLQVHYDSQILNLDKLLSHLTQAEGAIHQQLNSITVPSRVVHLPLSWDDPVCQQAIDKYTQSVRSDAPWCPSNLEFIRRINGLDSIEAVRKIVFDASYLVMGLGDVYLGAPVATPVNPSHRLVTTKYNPARTWTAENSVGIGGSYMCVYGMEGPGGYQFVGRTLQMWNRYRQTEAFTQPWLLRFFDQIRFFEVSASELEDIRRDFPLGRYPLRVEESAFNLSEYQELLESVESETSQFRHQRVKAFNEELAMWHRKGLFNYEHEELEVTEVEADWPDDAIVVDSSVAGSIWEISVEPGVMVQSGQSLMVIESMKMEITVEAPCDGVVTQLLSAQGARVNAGQALIVIEEKS
jgi:urea carboxylase